MYAQTSFSVSKPIKKKKKKSRKGMYIHKYEFSTLNPVCKFTSMSLVH